MVDIQSPTAEIRRGKKKKKEEEERNHRAKIEWPALESGHKNSVFRKTVRSGPKVTGLHLTFKNVG